MLPALPWQQGGGGYNKLNYIRSLFLAFVLILGISTSAYARTLEFVNYTGSTITQLYISNNNASGWGSDLLGSSVIKTNGTYSINIPSNAPTYIKIKVVVSGRGEWYWSNVNLSSLWRITFLNNGSKVRANWN
ncbi:MAG: hypothetical protein IJ563_00475 [Selenomonadaceae bacterium]|nr:hypothetical protein [Selenomonadaceae bacterium]